MALRLLSRRGASMALVASKTARRMGTTRVAVPSSLAPRVTHVEHCAEQRAIRVTWEDEYSALFHKKWLRDHCRCAQCLHPETMQRQTDTASIPANPAVRALELTPRKDGIAVAWHGRVQGTTCQASEFDAQWLREHAYSDGRYAYPRAVRQPSLQGQSLWDGTVQIPRHVYTDAMQDITPVMRDLHQFGIAMVTETPTSMHDTEQLARRIGFVMETIYGTMWTTNPQTDDQEYNDTASTNLELLHHTDGTYMRDPPGLQIFNCAATATTGGDSRYVDAFHAVEMLRRTAPDAFRILSSTPLPFHSFDCEAHLATMVPMIQLDHAGNVVQFRHNDYDRAPLAHLSFEEVGAFYAAHAQLLALLRDSAMELRVQLKVGETVIVDNHRVLHGRDAFEGGERALIGCYIGRTEYESRLRVLGII